MNLYNRQQYMNLNKNISILVCGCGGIGYWVAKFAAMSGIEKIYLYDPDVIEEHNLNRLDLPLNAIGKNKAQITGIIINELRPLISVYTFPFKYIETSPVKADWFIDCTDDYKSQLYNQSSSRKNGMRYVKAGYNGEHISINDEVAEWGIETDGYTIIPSWVVPATVIAALTVAKVMKYYDFEISTQIKNIFN